MSFVTAIRMYKLKQSFGGNRVTDLSTRLLEALQTCLPSADLGPGARIAITAGSRGIRHIDNMLKILVQALQQKGYRPFLVAAMGSHGGGEAEGQRDVLASLGITPQSVGAPVSCSSEVAQLGFTSDDPLELSIGHTPGLAGLPVYMAKEAYEADGILVVNRIKPHTAFRGDYESGLLKMLSVGLGRATGANIVHSLGADQLALAIPSIARAALERGPVIGGIAIVENGEEEISMIEGIPACELFSREKQILLEAKRMMPALPVERADLCLIGEMGKNYSGTGMDTNIIGRMRIRGVTEPELPDVTCVGVLGLSEASHGNAAGIGLADFTTDAVIKRIDRESTYLNCLTTGFVTRAAMPMAFKNDGELIDKAMFALKIKDPGSFRLVYIKNTLHLDEVWVSEPLYEQLRMKPLEWLEGPFPLPFDNEGNLLLPKH